MTNKSIFKYSLKYRKLIEINFYHNFDLDGFLKKYKITPSAQSIKVMKNHEIILKESKTGLVLLSAIDDKFKQPNFKGSINLTFYIDFFDPSFLNYTDILYKNNILIKFENRFKDKLHPGKFVNSKCIVEGDEKIRGLLNIETNKKDIFFGSESIFQNQPMVYSSHMNSRDVFLRYNFLIDKSEIKSYYITDDDEKIKLNNFKKRYLSSGKEVFYILIEKPIKLIEFVQTRYFLKKDDKFFKSYSLPLPSPSAKNITLDNNKNIFWADLIVNV